ncbi:hypothetical protein JANAI61_37470 [Jannaschia sp. AI_61]|nr:hypothetical protein JANAI61_37470 [Jannaschia sp. AI_61]
MRRAVLLGVLLGATALGAVAQEYGTGGVQVTLSSGVRASVEDNRALEPVSAGTSQEIVAPLSFNILSETRNSRLSVDFGGELGSVDIAGTSTDGDLDLRDAFAGLSYTRSSADARLSFDASVRDSDLSRGAVLDANGVDLIDGTATQRRSQAEVRLDWNTDTRAAFGAFARLNRTDYRDGTATGISGTLDDSQRETFGLTSRLDLSTAAQLDLGLSWSTFSSDGTPGDRDTVTFEAGLLIDRPLGALTGDLEVVDTEAGERLSLSVGRILSFPRGQVAASLGAVRGVSGETFATAGLSGAYEMSRGMLTYGAARDVRSSDEDDSERLVTNLSLGYIHDATAVSQVQFNLNYAETEATATGLSAATTTVGASYDRELTEDWRMSVGYRHRHRAQDGAASANSNQLFLNLNRDFVTRF